VGLKSVDGNGLREGWVSKELWKSVEKSKALGTPGAVPEIFGAGGVNATGTRGTCRLANFSRPQCTHHNIQFGQFPTTC